MKRFLAVVIAVACGCGSNSGSTDTDGGVGGGDGSGGSNVDPDGGTAGSHTINLTLTNRPNNATNFSFVVAYQDGTAGWQLAPAPTGDTYSFTVSAPVYGVAFTCIANTTGGGGGTVGQLRSVTTAHFAVSERTDLTFDVPARCTDRNNGATLSGNITNRPGNGVLLVQYGNRQAFVGTQTGNFSFQVPQGTRDLVVAHAVPTGNGDFYIDYALVDRNLMVTGNTQKTYDFSNAGLLDTYNVTVNVAGNPRIVSSTTLYTANGTSMQTVRAASNWESDALGVDEALATDVYDQQIAVSTFGQGATITHATSDPADQTWVAPAPLGMVTTSVPTKQPYVTLETRWPAYTNAVGYSWNAQQQVACQNAACTIAWTAYVSPGVVGAMPGYRMPDLSGLAGWKDTFAFQSGTQLTGGVTAVTSSAGAADFPTGIPKAGTDRAFVRSDFGLTP